MATKALSKTAKKELSAVARGLNLDISLKHAVEVSNILRRMKIEKAKLVLNEVIAKKCAVPFKRYNRDVGHKPGMAAGRYPVKACKEILKILKSAVSNAIDKGLSAESLVISSIIANKGTTSLKYGRKRSRRAKRTHIEIVVTEVSEEKTKRKPKDTDEKKEDKQPKKPEKKGEKVKSNSAAKQATKEKK